MAQPSSPRPDAGPPFSWPLERELGHWELLPGLPPEPRRSAWQRWGRNLVLFLLTAASVFLVGAQPQPVRLPGGGTAWTMDARAGLLLVAGLLSILVAHEMGHYLTARRYGVDATLPFFIPFPVPGVSLIGTLGAFIRIRSPFPNRKSLFDIGVAGPLAGFAVCLPVLVLGVLEAQVLPNDTSPGVLHFGEPLLFQWVIRWLLPPVPEGMSVVIGPLGMAAWFGLLVTALNLMPIGQLDGGHVTYALLRERARRISIIGSWVAVALIYFGPSWILWAVLLRALGRRHPTTLDDDAPVGRARVFVGLLALAIFVVCFVPEPIVFSWRDAFASLRELLPAALGGR